MHQRLGHPGKNKHYKSSDIIGEAISTTPSSIIPCEDCSLTKIRHQYLLKYNTS